MSGRGRMVATGTGVALGAVLLIAGFRWRGFRDWWRFHATFEPAGRSAEGLPEYRHRRTGVRVVQARKAALVRLDGRVTLGKRFHRDVSERLRFALEPERGGTGVSGWTIALGDPVRWTEEFSSRVTPPYHGINDRSIEGWHFRNSDNTGPNELGPKNVNAPGKLRGFSFVLDHADWLLATDTLDRLLHDGASPPASRAAVRLQLEQLVLGTGRMRIRDLDIGFGPAGAATIQSMSFDVELEIPWSRFGSVFFSGSRAE